MVATALALTLLVAPPLQAEEIPIVKIKVDGLERQFRIYAPKTKDARPRPVVFAFHGHGGNMNYAVRKFRFHETWPEAISVYMQGIPTKGMTDPEGLRNGWQQRIGTEGDRDIKFFDRVLAWVKKKHRIDEKNLFSMGHSNGAAFTMALWNAHPDKFKGLGMCAGGGFARFLNSPTAFFASSGRNDPLVRFEGQLRSVNQVKRINRAFGEGKEIAPFTTRWDGDKPVVWFVNDGGHELPEEALSELTKFFKELASPADPPKAEN